MDRANTTVMYNVFVTLFFTCSLHFKKQYMVTCPTFCIFVRWQIDNLYQ